MRIDWPALLTSTSRRPCRFEHRRHQIARRLLVGEVGLVIAGAGKLGRHALADIGGAARVQRDLVAVARQATRRGGADPRGRAGDRGQRDQTPDFSASSVSSGRSTIMKCPLLGMTTVRAPAMAAASGLRLDGGRHEIAVAQHQHGRALDRGRAARARPCRRCRRRDRCGSRRAGCRDSTASDSRRSHRPGETMPPLCRALPMPQKVISSWTLRRVGLGRFQHLGMNRHLGRDTAQAERRAPCRESAQRSRRRPARPWSGRPAPPA